MADEGALNRRRHFRVRYPEGCRPVARLGSPGSGALATVIDVSEIGLRLLLGHTSPVLEAEPGTVVSGTVRLHDGFSYVVSGRLVRVEGNFVCVELDDVRVPFPAVIAEQRWVRKWGEHQRTAGTLRIR
jgi:PilZ domain